MDVKVDYELMNSSSYSGIELTMPLLYNKVAERMAEELPSRLKGIECEIHKDQSKGLITVVAGEQVGFRKSNFCCKEFKDRFDF